MYECVRLTHFGGGAAAAAGNDDKLNGKTVWTKNVFSKYLLINLSKTRRFNTILYIIPSHHHSKRSRKIRFIQT